jgi:hypothetical protein
MEINQALIARNPAFVRKIADFICLSLDQMENRR